MTSFTFGPVTVTKVNELEEWRFPARVLFPTLTDAALAEAEVDWTPRLADNTSKELMLDINCWLIKTPQSTILVDSGNGNAKERPLTRAHHMFDTPFLDALRAAGAPPEEVNFVISTHLHQDHCGWDTQLVDGKWVPTFPNAEHLFSRAELAHVSSYGRNDPEDTVAYDFFRTYIDTIEPVLLAGLGRVVDDTYDVYDDGATRVRIEVVGGHTPGHLIVKIDSPQQSAVLSGDVIHHPLQFKDLDLPQVGDVDTAHAAMVRRKLAEEVADRDVLLLTAHFPWAGRVSRAGQGTFAFERADETQD